MTDSAGTSDSMYRAYIDTLNARRWTDLGQFVTDPMVHNGVELSVAGFVDLLSRDVRDIPDLRYAIDILVSDASYVASRLSFDCHPHGQFRGIAVEGRRVRFSENVFYRLRDNKIEQVWSLVDLDAITRQLDGGSERGGKPRDT